MNLSRRGILGGIICAPAIVRASSIMQIKMLHPDVISSEDVMAAFLRSYSQQVYKRYMELRPPFGKFVDYPEINRQGYITTRRIAVFDK